MAAPNPRRAIWDRPGARAVLRQGLSFPFPVGRSPWTSVQAGPLRGECITKPGLHCPLRWGRVGGWALFVRVDAWPAGPRRRLRVRGI